MSSCCYYGNFWKFIKLGSETPETKLYYSLRVRVSFSLLTCQRN